MIKPVCTNISMQHLQFVLMAPSSSQDNYDKNRSEKFGVEGHEDGKGKRWRRIDRGNPTEKKNTTAYN